MGIDMEISRKLWVMCVLFAFAVPAYADDLSGFKQAYAQYERYIDANETTLALESIRDAYRFGVRLFGKKSVNTANLAINYAKLLNDQNDFKPARKILKGKDQILASHYGEDGVELVPLLIEMGRAAKEPAKALSHLQRAGSLSRGYEDNLMEAQKNFEIMFILLARGGASRTEPYVDRAFEIYQDRLAANDLRLGLTAYHKARWATTRGEFDQTLQYLHQSLTAFEGPVAQPMGELERGVRVQLVQTLERLGRSREATRHLLTIGAAIPWSATGGPVYRGQTNLRAATLAPLVQGEIRLSFTVDENGFVVAPRVLESTNSELNDPALEMVQRFRYVPRFADDHAVATPDVEYTESFSPAVTGQKAPRRFKRPGERGFMNTDMFDISDCGSDTNNSQSCDRLDNLKGGK